MQDKTPTTTRSTTSTEPKIVFRADVDQNGDWYVWRKLSKNGWATMRRCECREAALQLAEALNQDPETSLFHG